MANTRDELLRALEAEMRGSTADGVFFLQAVAERSGLNLSDLQCINILTITGPITAGQLAEEMRLSTGAITGLVNRLERAGYVRRAKDPADGRRVVVELDAEALERAGAGIFGSQGKEIMDALIAGYDDRELAVILDFTRKSNALTRAELARLRAGSAGDAGDEPANSLEGVTSGRLVFINGAYKLTLRAESEMDDLYLADFEGSPPKVEVNDGVVSVRYGRRFRLFDWRGQPAAFTLNAAVPWAIDIRGGAVEVDADLSVLTLTSFTSSRGAINLRLILPEPSGVVPVRLSGGAIGITIRRPPGVVVRLHVKGGYNEVTLDDQVIGAMGDKLQIQSPGGGDALDRYEIEVSGGANEVKIL